MKKPTTIECVQPTHHGEEDKTMSKMGNFVMDMQVDAVDMTLDEFTNKYGLHNVYIWKQARYTQEPDPEPYYYPGSDPQT
jgi:hypothetical protein